MIPISIMMDGFLSYRTRTTIDFTGFDVACISGPNGAGKSSILDAITWCLFGIARKRNEDIINVHASVAEVAYSFEYEGNTYRAIRNLGRGRSTRLEFQVRGMTGGSVMWVPITEKTVRDTQEVIEDTLRMDYEGFVNTSFFLQGEADLFAQQKPGERKRILSKIMGLGIWEEYRNRVSCLRLVEGGNLATVDGRLKEISLSLQDEIPRRVRLADLENDLAVIVAARDTAETNLSTLENIANSEQARLAEELAGLRKRLDEITNLKSSLSELYALVRKLNTEISDIEEKIKTKDTCLILAQAALSEKQADNVRLKSEMSKIKDNIERLKSTDTGVCPTCGQELGDEEKISLITSLTVEGQAMGIKYRQNAVLIVGLETEVNAQLKIGADLEGVRFTNISAKSKTDAKIDQAENQVAEWERVGAVRLTELENQDIQDAHLPDIEKAKADLSALKVKENHLRLDIGAAQQKVRILDDLKARKRDIEAEREEIAGIISQYKLLEKAFGKDGIPALLIEAALPELEKEANEILYQLSDGGMSVQFATQREYKDAKREDLKETLDILISDGVAVRDYETYSGGETFRVNFAVRLALSKFLSRRAGARMQFLVIDEGFGTQDDQGRDRLVAAINLVSMEFAKVLVITHVPALKDAFPVMIEVRKGESGSSISVTEP